MYIVFMKKERMKKKSLVCITYRVADDDARVLWAQTLGLTLALMFRSRAGGHWMFVRSRRASESSVRDACAVRLCTGGAAYGARSSTTPRPAASRARGEDFSLLITAGVVPAARESRMHARNIFLRAEHTTRAQPGDGNQRRNATNCNNQQNINMLNLRIYKFNSILFQ